MPTPSVLKLEDAPASATERYCIQCQYPLRGLDSRQCPECGRPFDPDDATTFLLSQGKFAARWLKPANWLKPTARLLVAGTLGFAAVSPALERCLVVIVLCEWVALGVLWLPRAALRRWAVRLNHRSGDALNVDASSIRVVRMTFLLAVPIIWLRIPFYLFFFANLHWFQLAEKHWFEELPFPTAQSPSGFHMVGIFPVKDIQASTEGVKFTLPGFGNLIFVPPQTSGQGGFYDGWHTEPESFD